MADSDVESNGDAAEVAKALNREPFRDITNNIVNGGANQQERQPIDNQLQNEAANNNNEHVQEEDPEIHINNQVPAAGVHVSTGLLEYMESRPEGQAILRHYKKALENGEPMKKKEKNRLTRLAIQREKNFILRNIKEDEKLQKFVIKGERLQNLANDIEYLFKYESAKTYYYAYEHTQQGSKEIITLASGKLWNYYNYTKKKLREDQLLQGKARGRPTNILSAEELETATTADEHIEWLTINLEPYEELIERWMACVELRRAMLMQMSIYDYMQKFPCLRTQEAKFMFQADFESIYPEKEFVGNQEWESSKKILITSLKSCKLSNEDSILFGLLYSGDLSPEKEDFLLLFLLCYLIKPRRSGKRKRGEAADERPRKLSLGERRESFILRVDSANDIETRLRDLKQRYANDRETLQPLILAFGPANRINKFHVVVDDQMFDADNVLEALKLAFHAFFALNCGYPKYTKTLWVFLQKILFKIDLPEDELTLDAIAILGQIKDM